MKFKLDENFGSRAVEVFSREGHDVHTVWQEGISGTNDRTLLKTCCDEGRCLVTFDMDFSDVFRFPPGDAAGIIVVRLPENPSLLLVESMVRSFLSIISGNSPVGCLWVVEPGRIRIHQK